MKTGIDKIALHTTDFEVRNYSNTIFGINSNRRQGLKEGLPVFRDLNGAEVEANSFYHNSTLANYDINKKGLKISFNPSKQFHPYNLISTGEALESVINSIETELSEIGIKTNLNSSKIVRADITKNAILEAPFEFYLPALRLIRGKRQETTEYPNGYLISNSLHQTIIYDKAKKLELDEATCIIPKNLFRGEVRATKGKAVSRFFNFSKLSELMELHSSELDNSYKTYMSEIIFNSKNTEQQLSISFEDEVQFFQSLQEQFPRGYFNEWLNIFGIDYLLIKFGSLNNIQILFRESGQSRTNIYRFTKTIQRLIETRGQLSNLRREKTASEQLHEIKTKLIA
jgi:hypothetical protein